MARPTQYERPPDLTRDATAVKVAIKHLTPEDRARLIAWLMLYYDDRGELFSPQISRHRKRIKIDSIEYWLAKVPRTARKPHP
jgi:hypothetical protein